MVPVKETLTITMLERVYWSLAALAIVLGFTTVGFITIEPFWPLAFCLYSAATVFRLGAGGIMNRMGDVATDETVNVWNKRYHRFVVIVLNAGVGVVFLAATIWYRMWEAVLVTTLAFIVYFIASKFTRPNTYGARLRSAVLTVYLTGALAHFAGLPYGLVILGVVLGASGASVRLRALQRRFGWANR